MWDFLRKHAVLVASKKKIPKVALLGAHWKKESPEPMTMNLERV